MKSYTIFLAWLRPAQNRGRNVHSTAKGTKRTAYKSCVTLSVLHKVGFDILNHQTFNPGFASDASHLFPRMKKDLGLKTLSTLLKTGRWLRHTLKIKKNYLIFYFHPFSPISEQKSSIVSCEKVLLGYIIYWSCYTIRPRLVP